MTAVTEAEVMLRLMQASSCFRDGGVCTMLPCACAESLARARPAAPQPPADAPEIAEVVKRLGNLQGYSAATGELAIDLIRRIVGDLEQLRAIRDGCEKMLQERKAEIGRLRAALEAIKRATVAGKVCDDVAWFDGITTLYDYCDLVLNGSTCEQKAREEK